MAFAHHHGVGLPGSTMAIMAPSGGPLKTAGVQGKSRRVPGVRALWGQRWTRLPFFEDARSTATTRVWRPPTSTAAALARESTTAIMAPSGGPLEAPTLRMTHDTVLLRRNHHLDHELKYTESSYGLLFDVAREIGSEAATPQTRQTSSSRCQPCLTI
jgi:hypothetical protein